MAGRWDVPVGAWVCMTHGRCDPDTSGPVRCCPTCAQVAYRVVADRRVGRTYVPDQPVVCPAGHPLRPGSHKVGYELCPVHGGHRSWRCELCGGWLFWPPVDDRCGIHR